MSFMSDLALRRDDHCRRAIIDWLDELVIADSLTHGDTLDIVSLLGTLGSLHANAMQDHKHDFALVVWAKIVSLRGLLAYAMAMQWGISTSEIQAKLAKEAGLVNEPYLSVKDQIGRRRRRLTGKTVAEAARSHTL